MDKDLKYLRKWGQPIFLAIIVLAGILPFFESNPPEAGVDSEIILSQNLEISELSIIQNNSLLAISSPFDFQPRVVRLLPVIITAYSSTPWETDGNPYITAAGTLVRDGVIANNFLPFKTKVRIPELYGDKIFVVEDRMNWKKGNYHIDIWFSSYWEAINFGVKRAYIEILEN